MICNSYTAMVELDGLTAPMPFDDALLLEVILSTIDYVGECWVPQGPRLPAGYVHLKAPNSKRILYVHRFVAHYFCGLDLDSDQYECHHLCHNKSCCRPTHLEALTIQEHKRRTQEEGEYVCGSAYPTATFTDEELIELRNRYRSGATCAELADELDSNKSTMWRALTGETYGNVPGAVTEIPYKRDHSGERHEQAKLKEADIAPIYKAFWEEGIGIVALGKQYGISDETIRAVVQDKTWKHVSRPAVTYNRVKVGRNRYRLVKKQAA